MTAVTALHSVAPYLWISQSNLYQTNSGLWCDGGEAVLVDPGIYPDELEAIAGFLEEREATARHLVLTHSHWDHILGPACFPGATVVAHAAYLEEILPPHDELIRREIARWAGRSGVERAEHFAIPQPDTTFDQTHDLVVGALTLRLVHAPGHAADQLVVYHAGERVLWASDMLSDLEIPYVSHNLAAYERTLAMLSGWEIEVAVPGHGHVARGAEVQDRLDDDRAYLEALRGRVENAVEAGRTLEETVELCADIDFREPEANQGPHRLNVESAYAELGGKVESDPVGWDRIIEE